MYDTGCCIYFYKETAKTQARPQPRQHLPSPYFFGPRVLRARDDDEPPPSLANLGGGRTRIQQHNRARDIDENRALSGCVVRGIPYSNYFPSSICMSRCRHLRAQGGGEGGRQVRLVCICVSFAFVLFRFDSILQNAFYHTLLLYLRQSGLMVSLTNAANPGYKTASLLRSLPVSHLNFNSNFREKARPQSQAGSSIREQRRERKSWSSSQRGMCRQTDQKKCLKYEFTLLKCSVYWYG
jgi:hypothetical protein